uniref:HDC08957 n=1 Tax=Drosophila melanogaster TaxID=7227 RepID=Q6ILM2_DROME|nr:TPA_inf: HDC08957 [Drosophila melanogaster]
MSMSLLLGVCVEVNASCNANRSYDNPLVGYIVLATPCPRAFVVSRMSDRATFVICGFRAHVQQRQQQRQWQLQLASNNWQQRLHQLGGPPNSWSNVRLSICPSSGFWPPD